MGRPRVHRSNQNQTPHPLGSQSRGHHRDGTAVRGSQQIKRGDANAIQKTQQTFGMGPEAAVSIWRPVGEADARHVNREERRLGGQGRDRKSPGERVAEQSVEEEQGRP